MCFAGFGHLAGHTGQPALLTSQTFQTYLELSQYGGDVCFVGQVSQNLQLQNLKRQYKGQANRKTSLNVTEHMTSVIHLQCFDVCGIC